jgi:hypothetical protein
MEETKVEKIKGGYYITTQIIRPPDKAEYAASESEHVFLRAKVMKDFVPTVPLAALRLAALHRARDILNAEIEPLESLLGHNLV